MKPPMKAFSQAAKLLGASCAAPQSASELCMRANLMMSSYTARNLEKLVEEKFLDVQELTGRVKLVYSLTRAGEAELDRLFRVAR